MSKSAEDILNEMPSGDDLLASLAQEVGIDLNAKPEPKENTKATEQAKKESEKSSEGSAKDAIPADTKPKSTRGRKKKVEPSKEEPVKAEEKPEPKKAEEKPKSKATTKGKTKQKSKIEKSTEKVEKSTRPDRKAVFGEWRGFKVNYMGKPMTEEGKFITLPKRYDSKAQEKFRDVNGRMVLVIERNKDGKVQSVKVFAEDTKGNRDELTTNGVMVNPNRMENRCRVYANLLDLAYDRKKDIEENIV